jgi:hypothetical protein
MSEAVLDNAIEQIADGMSVDWSSFDRGAAAREGEWAKSLRVISEIVNLHRAAAVDWEQTTLTSAVSREHRTESDAWGKYRLANKVGEGSYGSVYRAWDSELERDVAIKILHRRVGDDRLKERLLHEGRALAKIRHNNVVNVLGVEAHGDRVGLCMEFVQGKTLADVVRTQGKLSARDAVLIGEDLCRALAAVHRAGYIHRDVKAKNVVRDDTGRIVLMDFGTGRTAEQQEGKNDRTGTPLYMAPELLEGGQASACSDVYSLGVLLYHLVSGEYPVHAKSVEELRAAHANREHRWLSERRPDLPVAFMQVVERAIAPDPEERYQNASELQLALAPLKIERASRLWRVAKPLLTIALVIAGMFAIGALTSAFFNSALGRADFTTETWRDWVTWGRMTSIPPLFMLMLTLLALTPVLVIRRLMIAVSTHVQRWDAAARRRIRSVAHRLRLDTVAVLAACAVAVSGLAIALAWWYFLPLLSALVTNLSLGAPDDLRWLAPEFLAYHNRYRLVYSAVVMLSVVVWYPVFKLVRRGQTVHPGMVACGVVLVGTALVFLHFPYRLLYFSDVFVAVNWNGANCYVIGERANEELLFCPEMPPPRNRIVKKEAAGLTHLGITESLFAPFGPRFGAKGPDQR